MDRNTREGIVQRLGGPILAAAIGGLATGAFFITLVTAGLPADHTLVRYTMGHWIEMVEVAFFFWGLAYLGLIALRQPMERAALRRNWLETTRGPVPATAASRLLQQVDSVGGAWRKTHLGRRLVHALQDVGERQAADHLDGYLKDLADQAANASHGSFALPKVIAWAIPILGFLGTVIGITIAIANITPQQLEESLPEVTGGLAVAFDTTALALMLSMGLIFLMHVVERREESLLDAVEEKARRLLSHRFLQTSPDSAPFLSAVHAASSQVITHTHALIERQAELWNHAMEAWNARMEELAIQRENAMTSAIERLSQQWQRDTSLWDRWQSQMDQTAARLTRMSELLTQRTGEERGLIAAQERLAENLRMLRETQSFDEALHSLTAAIHLLTIRAGAVAERSSVLGERPAA